MPICLTGDPSDCGSDRQRIQTHNFEFRSYRDDEESLPGDFTVNQECNWECRNIQVNVNIVANFIEDRITSLDFYWASINVVEQRSDDREWQNAGWHTTVKQVVFGQKKHPSGFISYGTDITIVAHEFCHGIIQKFGQGQGDEGDRDRGRPEISAFHIHNNKETLALEESLCDIFAILFCNYNQQICNYNQQTERWNQDITSWQWEVGSSICEITQEIRSLKYPFSYLSSRLRQGDFLSYHDLSLIHSHAFYLFMTEKDYNGNYFFDGEFALNLLGGVLEYLNPDSDFSHSRKLFEKSAKTLLREDPSGMQKLQAISDAFDRVGIQQMIE